MFLPLYSCLYFFGAIVTGGEEDVKDHLKRLLTGTAEQLRGGVFSYKAIVRNRVFSGEGISRNCTCILEEGDHGSFWCVSWIGVLFLTWQHRRPVCS